jgi:hemoglobin-like flavoprotein
VFHVDFLLRTLELPVWFVSANGWHIVRRMYKELFRNTNGTAVHCDDDDNKQQQQQQQQQHSLLRDRVLRVGTNI